MGESWGEYAPNTDNICMLQKSRRREREKRAREESVCERERERDEKKKRDQKFPLQSSESQLEKTREERPEEEAG